jgi:hypothetical protein
MFLRELVPDYPSLNVSVFDVEKAVTELIRAAENSSDGVREKSSDGSSATKSRRGDKG